MIKNLHQRLARRVYYIGLLNKEDIDLSAKQRFKKIRWIDLGNYKHGWFADPFIYSIDENKIEIFAEEYEFYNNKGRLVCLTIAKDGYRLLKVDEILTLETHLSFPIYIKSDGKCYVYPENNESGSLKIYEYDTVKKKLINPLTIINEPLMDTQICTIDGKYYAFGVKYSIGKQIDTKVLYIYEAESLLGDYKLIQTICNEQCEERGAGKIFEYNGMLIRPAQCCEGDYGKAVILYKLKKDSNGRFSEEEVLRIEPNWTYRYGRGLHTFNAKAGLIAVDGNGYVYWRLNGFLRKLLRK